MRSYTYKDVFSNAEAFCAFWSIKYKFVLNTLMRIFLEDCTLDICFHPYLKNCRAEWLFQMDIKKADSEIYYILERASEQIYNLDRNKVEEIMVLIEECLLLNANEILSLYGQS